MRLNKRKIVDLEVDGVDTRDYPDFVDAFISQAYWDDTGKELTDAELEELNDKHPEIAQEMAYETCF